MREAALARSTLENRLHHVSAFLHRQQPILVFLPIMLLTLVLAKREREKVDTADCWRLRASIVSNFYLLLLLFVFHRSHLTHSLPPSTTDLRFRRERERVENHLKQTSTRFRFILLLFIHSFLLLLAFCYVHAMVGSYGKFCFISISALCLRSCSYNPPSTTLTQKKSKTREKTFLTTAKFVVDVVYSCESRGEGVLSIWYYWNWRQSCQMELKETAKIAVKLLEIDSWRNFVSVLVNFYLCVNRAEQFWWST